MLTLHGPTALSYFRLERLLSQTSYLCPQVMGLTAEFVHFVDIEGELSPQETMILNSLLDYGQGKIEKSQNTEKHELEKLNAEELNSDGLNAEKLKAEILILVIPRKGTVSPWSSKATDIAHSCSLKKIRRIERGIAYYVEASEILSQDDTQTIADILHDRINETVLYDLDEATHLFETHPPQPLQVIPTLDQGIHVSSERCRHKIFNAQWMIDGVFKSQSLFSMIKHTYDMNPRGILSAYHDNTAVMVGGDAICFYINPVTHEYQTQLEPIHCVIKVETRNHTTGISPYAGAASGVRGEMQNEASTDRCAKSKAGMVGFCVSNLEIPGFLQPWEISYGRPQCLASPLDIMLEGPMGSSQFSNEFGRPTLTGFFRTFEQKIKLEQDIHQELHQNIRGYHKPIMITGGMSRIRHMHVQTVKMTPLFGNVQREICHTNHIPRTLPEFNLSPINIDEAAFRLLRLPCIADKSFLITINDRTVTGLVVRDPLVGPWQVPVADCAVTVRDFEGIQGEAMSVGERPLLALINPRSSARMSVGEAITNIAAACIGVLSDIRLSANWMAAAEFEDEAARLYDAVQAVCLELCPALHITIPVVTDSLSMQTTWEENEKNETGETNESEMGIENKNKNEKNKTKRVVSPLSVVITAFAPVMDGRRTLTPYLLRDAEDSQLIFVDLSGGHARMGGSALAQVYGQLGNTCPDLEDPALIKGFFAAIQQLNLENKILAYHDRSDGGLLITLCEMAFAGHIGLQVDISALGNEPKSILFNEELGAVLQVHADAVEAVLEQLNDAGLHRCFSIGTLDESDLITLVYDEQVIFSTDRVVLQKAWAETSYHFKAIRDNPRTAKKEFEILNDKEDPGLNASLTFNLAEDVAAPYLNLNTKPKVAILREQGVNGHIEMAAAFHRAGFTALDVHMNDLQNGEMSLSSVAGLAVCGGFSFGDVLGAGLAFAKRILFNPKLRNEFETFFQRSDTFTLGVSNGAQVLTGLKSIIPGAERWPNFMNNFSEQFESRLCMVEIETSPSILLEGMTGSILPVPVAHAVGRAEFITEEDQEYMLKHHFVTLRYVDSRGRKTNLYPANPNGSPLGITGLTTADGRINIMMPHPERAFRSLQYSWHPKEWGEEGPWLRLFRNARMWVG